jgi:hypothetical protein
MDVNHTTTTLDVLQFLRTKYPVANALLFCQDRPLGDKVVLAVNPGLTYSFQARLQLEFQTPEGPANLNLGREATVGEAETHLAAFLHAPIDCVRIISAGEFIAERSLKVWKLKAPLLCEVSERPLARFRIDGQVIHLDSDPSTTFSDVKPRL